MVGTEGDRNVKLQERIDIDLEDLLVKLPSNIQGVIRDREDMGDLLEIILDLGRLPEARFPDKTLILSANEVTSEEIQYVMDCVGDFGGDNRAGIERTLHRISAIRNRNGRTIGLTVRVGRAVYGTVRIIEDLIASGKSILLLGKPGVGKTTMLREVARVLADDANKRVIVVDTSNEIAGDGDVPHPGIGRARRMQVRSPEYQHSVMIEAVENHMPEVIIIDEIGTELDANASRTIAERGVQLVATAHGNTLQNLIMNPTLSDLVGGIQSVTLGDIEASRRRTQKSVLERRAPPTFDTLVEIQSWSRVIVHPDVTEVVDKILRGFSYTPQTRIINDDGQIERTFISNRDDRSMEAIDTPTLSGSLTVESGNDDVLEVPEKMVTILPYGVNKGKLQDALHKTNGSIGIVSRIDEADLLVTTKNYYRRRTQALLMAEKKGKPVYVLRKNTVTQIEQFIKAISRKKGKKVSEELLTNAVKEAERAVQQIGQGKAEIELHPQGSYVRHLQHQIADQYGLKSASSGREPSRHVVISRL